jgi:hypothetical protein
MAGGGGFCLHPAAFHAGQPRFTRAIAVKNRSHNQKQQSFFIDQTGRFSDQRLA